MKRTDIERARMSALLFRRVGDSLLAVPALRALKLRYPESYLSVICESHVTRVFAGLSFIDEICDVGKSPSSFKLLNALRESKSTVTLDFLSDPRTAIACALHRAGVRVGFAKSLRQYVYTHRVAGQNPTAPIYSALHKLEFARTLNAESAQCLPEFSLTSENERRAEIAFGESGGNRVAMYITSRREYKRWPLERFSEISRRLQADGQRVAVIAGPGESESAQMFCKIASLGKDSVVSFYDIGDMAAFLKLCRCYVGNDGGPKHLALSVGTPTVTVFQNDPWEYWTPPNERKHLAVGGPHQSPDIDTVWQAVQTVLLNNHA